MSRLFTRPRTDDPPDPTAAERRARADALHARVTRTLQVRPPADGDVTTGCGLCGVAAVTVDGARRFPVAHRTTAAVCATCQGSGSLGVGTCQDCRTGTPRRTVDVEYDATREVAARDMHRDDLARRHWHRLHVSRLALDVPGGGTVTLHLCPDCAAVYEDRRSRGFGRDLVEHLLTGAGWTFRAGEGLASIRTVTHASRVLDARRRGTHEPAANAVPWEHLSRTIRRADDLPEPGETRDSRLGAFAP